MILRRVAIALLVALVALVSVNVAAQRLRLRPAFPVANTGTLQQSDFTYLGFFEVPTGHAPNTGDGDFQRLAFRNVSGVEHVLLEQNCCHGNFTSIGPAGIYEYTDPGSYGTDLATAPHGTFIKNWGQTAGGAAYDMWGGTFGTSVCFTTTPWTHSTNAPPCTPGTMVEIGNVGTGIPNNQAQGLAWHDDGSGTCCVYATYGQGYSNYSADDNVIVAALDTQGGNGHWGPFRTCSGTYGLNGTGGQVCGGFRGFWMFDMPDGSMGISGSSGGYQNSNTGPSIFSGAAWPVSSTPQGYGSTRGTVAYRSTDIVSTLDALATYSMNGNVNHDGSIITGPNTSFRRTTDATQGNYTFDSDGGDIPQQINPALYGGVGSFTAMDVIDGAAYLNTSPKSGLIVGATLQVGHVWYKTPAGHTYLADGAAPTLIFQRNVDEAGGCTYFTDPNADLEFDSKPAAYTNVVANAVSIQFINPGTPNATASVTTSANAIAVHLATNGSSQVTTTANQVISLIAGNSTANSLVSVSTTGVANLCSGQGSGRTSNGTGIVDTITQGTKYSGDNINSQIVSGVMTYGNGPMWCPVHNIDSHQTVTGPTSTATQPALIVYSTTKVQAAPTSGNPDYSLDPESTIFLRNISSTMLFNSGQNSYLDQIGGVGFDPTTKKLYVAAPFVDTQTYPGCCSKMPIVHVFSVNTGLPAPMPTDWTLGLALVALAIPRVHRRMQ